MRHPHVIAREQRAMRQARVSGRRHRLDDRESDDARYTDDFIEPYQSRRSACVALVDTDRGWKKGGQFLAHGPAIDFANTCARHCVVRDARTWRVIFDNRKA